MTWTATLWRDSALKKVRDQPKPDAPKAAALFGIIGDWLAAGDKSPLDLNRLNEILEAMPASPRANSTSSPAFFSIATASRTLHIDYLKRANDKECLHWFRLIAGMHFAPGRSTLVRFRGEGSLVHWISVSGLSA